MPNGDSSERITRSQAREDEKLKRKHEDSLNKGMSTGGTFPKRRRIEPTSEATTENSLREQKAKNMLSGGTSRVEGQQNIPEDIPIEIDTIIKAGSPVSSIKREMEALKGNISKKLLSRDYFSYNEKHTLYENTVRYLKESPLFHSQIREHPGDAQSALRSINTDIQACSRLKIDLEACHKSYYHEAMKKRIQKYDSESYKLVTSNMIQTATDGYKTYKKIVETAPNKEIHWELASGEGSKALRLMHLGMKPVHFHVAENVGDATGTNYLSYAKLHEIGIHVELHAGDTKDSITFFITREDFLKKCNHLAKYFSHITNENDDIHFVETHSAFHDFDPDNPSSIPSAVKYPDNLHAMYSQRGVLQIYNTYPDLFHEEQEAYNLRGPDAIRNLIYRYITTPRNSNTEMIGKFGLLCGFPFHAVYEASKDEHSEKLNPLEYPGRKKEVPGLEYARFNETEDSALKEKFDTLSRTSEMDLYVAFLERKFPRYMLYAERYPDW